MSERIRAWWIALSLREQRLILVMFALMAVVAVWLVVLWIGTGLSDARRSHAEAVIEHAEVAGKVQALKDLQRGAPPPLPAPVDVVIGQSASELGLVLSTIDADGGNSASLSIASVRPVAFFGWVADLERQGIIPERLVARANSDRTIAVEATFKGRPR